jgi:DNA-binding FrmR family transcriptional regulator
VQMGNRDINEKDGKQEVITRLKRIEGQVKGIQKMIEEDKYCVDILTQIAAVRAAINRVGGIVLERHTITCMQNALSSGEQEQVVKDLVNTVQKFLKFID